MLASKDISLLQETCYLLFDPKPHWDMPMHLHLHSFFFVIVFFFSSVCYCWLIQHRSHCTYFSGCQKHIHFKYRACKLLLRSERERESKSDTKTQLLLAWLWHDTTQCVCVWCLSWQRQKSMSKRYTHWPIEGALYKWSLLYLIVCLPRSFSLVATKASFFFFFFSVVNLTAKLGANGEYCMIFCVIAIKFMWIKMKWEKNNHLSEFLVWSTHTHSDRDLNTFVLLWQFSIDVYCDLLTKLITHKSSSMP